MNVALSIRPATGTRSDRCLGDPFAGSRCSSRVARNDDRHPCPPTPSPSPHKESPTEPFKRAVAGCMRALARKPELEITYAAERPGIAGGKARLPEPPRKLSRAGRRDRARARGFDRAAARLPRSGGAPAADAERPAGPRGVRGGRAGARRGDRRAAHAGRGAKSRRDARRQVSSRQVRRHHRPRRRADRGCGRHDGARAPDRTGAAAGRAQAGRSVAAVHRGARRQRARPAGEAGREPAPLRRRDPRSARLARNGRRARARLGGDERGRFRRERPAAEPGRGRRQQGVRRRAGHEHGGDGSLRRRNARRRERGDGRALRRHAGRCRHGRLGSRERAVAAAPAWAERAARAGLQALHGEVRRDHRGAKICASRRSSTGCAAISTSSSRTCRAWCRGSPTGCSAG